MQAKFSMKAGLIQYHCKAAFEGIYTEVHFL